MNPVRTRLCFDPWDYLEVRPDGRVAPCCVGRAEAADLDDLQSWREGGAPAALRRGLLAGDIDEGCAACHLRPWTDTDTLRQALTERHPELATDPLRPAPGIDQLRLAATERCNLRCVYCIVSHPDYAGTAWEDGGERTPGGRHMDGATIDGVRAWLAGPSGVPVRELAFSGNGETTFLPGWQQAARQLADDGHRLSMISNFAREFDREELETLARFHFLSVSVDTADRALLRRVRRRVDLAMINLNLTRLSATARRLGLPGPTVEFSAGVYGEMLDGIEDFAWFAVAAGVRQVTFWKMRVYPELVDDQGVTPLNYLDAEAFAGARIELERTRDLLQSQGVRCVLMGDLLEGSERFSLEGVSCHVDDGRLSIQADYLPWRADGADANLFVAALAPDGAKRYCLANDGAVRPLSNPLRDVEGMALRTIRREAQRLEIELPLPDEIASDARFFIGIGPSLVDVLRERLYTPI